MATATIRPIQQQEAKKYFWQDSFALLLFLLLFGILGSNFEIGSLATFLERIRWGLLGLATLAGLKYVPQALEHGLSQVHKALIALMVVGLLSCAYSILPWYSFQRLMSFLMLWVALFIGAWGWLLQPGNLKHGVSMLYGLVWVTSAIGVFDIITAGPGGEDRADGAFDRATSAGTFAAVTLPIILWKIRYSKNVMRLAMIGLLAIQAYILFFSAARGALIAGGVGILAVIWRNYRRLGPLATGVVVGGGILLVAINGLEILPERIVRSESLGTLTGRTDRWQAAWHVYEKNPWIGYGHGVERFCISTDPEAVDMYYELVAGNRHARRMQMAVADGLLFEHTVHNEYLARLVEAGVAGLIVFLWFWIALLWGMVQAFFRPNNALADLVRCLYAAVWVIFIDSFLHSWMFAVGFGLNPILWYLITLTVAADWQLKQYERRVKVASATNGTARTPLRQPVPVAAT